jgi:hypothetical protein
VKAGAEVLASITAIAYSEQVIENLSFKWSDKVGMAKDILQSLAGNIPVVSNIVYALMNEQDMQISPVLGNLNNIVRNIGAGEGEKSAWYIAETFGTPKVIRRIKEGMEIMESGGITDKNGKMEAPVQDTIELVRSFLRGKYGSIAAQDWIRNIGEKTEDRRWFVPAVEFLQNGDYDRKAELYEQFSEEEQNELRDFLSEGQQKKLDSSLANREKAMSYYLDWISLPKQEAANKFNELAKTDPKIAKIVSDIFKSDKNEKLLSIKEEFESLGTDTDKKALWDEYVRKGIITKEVAKQLKTLLF